MDSSLVRLDQATRMLAEIRSIDDAIKIIDLAEAARVYAKQVKLGLVAQNHAAEIGLRAKRRAGEILSNMEKAKGGQPYQSTSSSVEPVEKERVPTYDDLEIAKTDAHRWQTIAAMPEEAFEKVIKEKKEKGEELTSAAIYREATGKHVSDDSYEWYTPLEYIYAIEEVLGHIDLDPASCKEANDIVGADRYFTKEDDGLVQNWSGRVFLNPPYSMPLVEQFTSKAIEEYQLGNIEAAIVLVNNATDTIWFHAMLEKFPVCFTKGRIRFIGPDGDSATGPRQGQAIFYLGKDIDKFATRFSEFGIVMERV